MKKLMALLLALMMLLSLAACGSKTESTEQNSEAQEETKEEESAVDPELKKTLDDYAELLMEAHGYVVTMYDENASFEDQADATGKLAGMSDKIKDGRSEIRNINKNSLNSDDRAYYDELVSKINFIFDDMYKIEQEALAADDTDTDTETDVETESDDE